MAISSAFVVRHTFLELVDETGDLQSPFASSNRRRRAFTDPASFFKSRAETDETAASDSTASDSPSSEGSSRKSSEFSSQSIGAWCDVSDSDDEEDNQNNVSWTFDVQQCEVSDTEEEEDHRNNVIRTDVQQCEAPPLAREVPVPATLMLQGIPQEYTRTMLCTLLDSVVAGCYDFVYLPQAFRKRKNNRSSFGYAFVNFGRVQDAQVAMDRLVGFQDWEVVSNKVLDVVWSKDCNGLGALVERYRNSPVMHNDVHDDCKPIILWCGVRVPFPPPTKHIQAPKQ